MSNRFLAPITVLMLGLVLLCQPLGAQLSPKLQTSKTDFLNLYQQSTNTRVKPEVLTIFDFSGSMEALMFHPLFVNSDTNDTGGVSMRFVLTPAVPGVPANNTYTITARSRQNTDAYVSWTLTVGGTVNAPASSGAQTQQKGSRTVRYLYTTVTGTAVSGTISGNATYTFNANLAMRATNASGTAITLGTYASASTAATLDGGLTWTVTGGSTSTASTSSTVNTSATSWNSNQSCNWTVPAYDGSTTAGTPAFVTATLPVAVGNKSSLTSTILVKPDGSQVTAADAAATTDSTQYGANSGQGAGDVRNWVRAASHVRFSTTVDSSVLRTIDIPIAWKITNASSTGNPLSSVTKLDLQVKTAPSGTITNYGSGANIELDKNWSIANGTRVFSSASNSTNAGTSGTQTGTQVLTVTYRRDYVVWLFTGKYQNGTYASLAKNYIVFDAADASLSPVQGAESWGQGYGSAAAGSFILVPNYNIDGTYSGTETRSDASVNIVPALTRVQAVKRAAITTWINHQADVLWAFRFLDSGTEASNGNATTINNNSATTFNVTAGAVTTYQTGRDSAWTVLNNTSSQGIASTSGNSVTGMGRIASLFAGNNTPLTYAMARGLAQFTDPKSVFNAVETGSDAPSQCMNHFLILFTDGLDNNATGDLNDNSDCPYYIASGSSFKIDALLGNHSIIGSPSNVNRDGSWWNLFTFAGIAAHLGDTSLGGTGIDYLSPIDPGSTPSGSVTPSSLLPFSLYKRNATLFTKPHLVTTMTVGVSLGGTLAAGGPKRSLFVAAAVGDPTLTTWADTNTLSPFKWDPNANDGNGGRVSGSIYYFDATDPDKLSKSLDYAILSAIGASNINTASSPSTPYIGAALGGEMFIGKFQPPINGGAVWTGDLLMFGTRLVNDNLQILNKSGTVTTTVDYTTAQWSAGAALANNRLWKDRHLYTRIPGNAATPEPGLTAFSDTGTAFTAPTTGLQNFISRAADSPSLASYGVGSTAQKLVTQWAMGGDTTLLDASSRATANRANIMGDIINSSPAVLEYNFGDVSSGLTSSLSAVGGNRFRLILVGTNQGWLHAFGEVTKQENAVTGDTSTPKIVKGNVDELWAFMPTDFLGYLDQLTVSSNPHRFMADGAPAIYHLDLPPSTGGAANGVVEVTSAPGPERAMVILGLGKGGRSYYALDIHNPYTPTLRWSIVPDEVDVKDASGNPALQARILSRPGAPAIDTVKDVIRNMGFSTCTPGIGRITLTDSTGLPVVHDAVFLGGGFSLPEVEANFPDASGNPTPMGRSVLVLDAYTGLILAAVDLRDRTASDGGSGSLRPGPIARGVVPFEFILNSGMAQRAYFLDYWGGLWSWGCQKTDTASTLPANGSPNPTYQYRMDSSDLSAWTLDGTATSNPGIRLVAKDISGNLITQYGYTNSQKYYSEALYSTLPAPFRVGSFPGHPKSSTSPIPAVVGIAIESGDRNNPLDYNYTTAATTGTTANPATKPIHHRVSVVFDRQDSLAWGTAVNPILISPASTAVLDAYPGHASYQANNALITPYSSTYFLGPNNSADTKFGFFANFPDTITPPGLIPKGINNPTVVSGSLYYSVFVPTAADPCTGGSGKTQTSVMCDLLNPIVADTRTNQACTSGVIWEPIGVASDFSALGTRGVIQIGTTAVNNPGAGASATTLATKTIAGKSTNRFPKARVWRTVH